MEWRYKVDAVAQRTTLTGARRVGGEWYAVAVVIPFARPDRGDPFEIRKAFGDAEIRGMARIGRILGGEKPDERYRVNGQTSTARTVDLFL
jgi:hypothetical protein